MRPVLSRVTSPASASTPMCFRMLGSETGNGSASSLMVKSGVSDRRSRIARRVASARAENVRSSFDG